MSSSTPTKNDITQESQKLLHAAALNIVALIDHVHKYEGTESTSAGFSGANLKRSINELADAIDKEVTRFLIACKPPALEVEIRALTPKILAGFFQLVQHFDRIPKLAGKTYLDAVRKAICRSLVAITMVFNSFIEEPVEVDKAVVAEMSYMASSGIFWEHCRALAQIPTDNRMAVVAVWTESVGSLVKDAAEELSESLQEAEAVDSKDSKDSEYSDDSMDDFDPEIPTHRVAEGRKIQKLVNVAKHTCDKIALRCIRDCAQLDDERTMWLDRLLDLGRPVQSSVDDLVATLFADEDVWMAQVGVEKEALKHALGELVTLAITFVDDSHLPWFELCRKQLDVAKHTSNVVR
ncbi:hypothetical protein LPJ66_003539 [Kickxella alabastrina]|uniref:Uncharacterized protein n=1 Tax=Kickxella alabastrina TaxID=61397 RepID=A0ACC1IMX4_9FUNG|nr:hypothetical protein LPJ66_003539 [Kickxella alabastrina]